MDISTEAPPSEPLGADETLIEDILLELSGSDVDCEQQDAYEKEKHDNKPITASFCGEEATVEGLSVRDTKAKASSNSRREATLGKLPLIAAVSPICGSLGEPRAEGTMITASQVENLDCPSDDEGEDEAVPVLPGAHRVGGSEETERRGTIIVGGHDDADGDRAPVNAHLVDDPVVAAEVGFDKTEELDDVKQRLSHSERNRRRQMRIGLGIGFVVVVAVVLTSIFTVRGGSDTTKGSPAPTPSPTSQLEASWIDLIQSRMSSTTFEDPISPQRQALDWMSQDPFTIALGEDRIIQRFALAVLYYATNGPMWDPHIVGWLGSTPECEWGESNLNCTEGDVVEEMKLNRGGLSGSLPKEIGLLSSLRVMRIQSNNLEGPIPTEIGQMTSLKWVDMRRSNLLGTIPTELGLLTALEFITIRINGLEGTIPSELGKLTSMTRLNLSSNNLFGTIPPEVIVPSFTTLSLKSNYDLSGMIPTELGSVPNMTSLLLEETQLTGTIPPHLCDTLTKAEIDCGEIECDCCSGRTEAGYVPC